MDYYKLLGIKETATKSEIKQAHHKYALKYHPDKNKDSSAEEKFRAIQKAYEILKDDDRRKQYDLFDLPQLRRSHQHDRHHHHHHPHRHRQKHSEEFFTGASERYSKEKSDQDRLEEIRRINEEELDKVNASLRRKPDDQRSGSGRARRSKVFTGSILADENDDDYEKIVLDRLRKLSNQ